MGGTESHVLVVERDPAIYAEACVLSTASSEENANALLLVKKEVASEGWWGSLGFGGAPIPEQYEVVLFNDKVSRRCFSIAQSNSLEDIQLEFSLWTETLLPFVDDFPSIYNVEKLMQIKKTKLEHPDWNALSIAAHLQIPEYADINQISCADNKKTIAASQSRETTALNDWLASGPLNVIRDKYPEFINSLASKFEHLNNAGRELKMKYMESPVHVAILLAHEGLLRKLLEKGASPDTPCGHAFPIHLAMQVQANQCARRLVEHDTCVLELRDRKYGGSPLHWVKNTECIDLLLEFGADPNARNADNETPLHIMVRRQRLSPLMSLICHGADVNALGQRSQTALHYSVMHDDVDIVRALLFLGADWSLRDENGKTALDLASENEANEHREDILDVFSLFISQDGATSSRKAHEQSPPVLRTKSILKEKTGKDALLALDGGGIRGLVLTEMLLTLEDVTGRSIYDLFDWITGTSTGSYLALSIAKGRSVRHCQRAYVRLGRSCFVGIRPYATEKMDRFLLEEFGEDSKMAGFDFPRLMVPAVLADRRPAMLHLFRNYDAPYDEHYQMRDARFPRPMTPSDQPQWLAIRSSCSAPSFFRATGRYLDGGLIANNPTLDALSEIHKCKKCERQQGLEPSPLGIVLSLGTGRPPVQNLPPIDLFRPSSVWDAPDVVGNVKAFLELMVDQATNSDDHVVDRARSWCEMANASFFRFSPSLSSNIELNETNDRILLGMLVDAKKYIIKNIEEFRKLGSQLLGC